MQSLRLHAKPTERISSHHGLHLSSFTHESLRSRDYTIIRNFQSSKHFLKRAPSREKTATYESRNWSAPDPQSAGALIMNFPAFRTVRKKCLLFINHSVYSLTEPKQTKTTLKTTNSHSLTSLKTQVITQFFDWLRNIFLHSVSLNQVQPGPYNTFFMYPKFLLS